jgi:hypothetical protein
MTGLRFKHIVGVMAGVALSVSSTGAVAAASAAPIREVSPWTALAVMSGAAPAAAVCGSPDAAAAAAAQGAGVGCVLPAQEAAPVAAAETPPPQPIPVPPVEPIGGGVGLGVDPLLLALGAILAGVGIYFLVKGGGSNNNSPA